MTTCGLASGKPNTTSAESLTSCWEFLILRVRFRTLGCCPLTGAVESEAVSIPEIILELLQSRQSERQGRVIDQDQIGAMEKKKQEGYF